MNDSMNLLDSLMKQAREESTVPEQSEPQRKIDELSLYFGKSHVVADTITIKQPTVGDFVEFGESAVYGIASPFISNPTTQRVELWEKGIDWNKISDFELFSMMIPNCNDELSHVLFEDLELSSFKKFYLKEGSASFVLINRQGIVITEKIYEEMAWYIREMLGVHPKEEKTKSKSTKIDMINEDKENRRIEAKNTSTTKSSRLLPMISFYLMHPGTNCTKEDIKNMSMYEFIYNIKRLSIYESTSALLHGMYSGFVDTSKINKKEFDFMREVE